MVTEVPGFFFFVGSICNNKERHVCAVHTCTVYSIKPCKNGWDRKQRTDLPPGPSYRFNSSRELQ